MKILKLTFQDFRNLQAGEFIPEDGVNIIYGQNAQGKTNLLEAMWIFTGGRSFRGTKDHDLISFSKEQSSLSLSFFAAEREQEAALKLQNNKRFVTLNGVDKKPASSLVGSFCAVIFSPEHLSLVKEGPSLRRTFIDAGLCQFKPVYAKILYQYNRILTQRNALLKDIPRHSELLDTLMVWDEKLAYYGAEILKERFLYLDSLSKPAQEIYAGIAKQGEELNLSYHCSLKGIEADRENCAAFLFQSLQDKRKNDLMAGYTTIGPHRDDLYIQINEVSARSYASQGQQRSVVLALKLAEARILAKKIREKPVIFLDDVMSELDASRQDYLLNHLDDEQVFITCCEPDSLKNAKKAAKFKMKAGYLI